MCKENLSKNVYGILLLLGLEKAKNRGERVRYQVINHHPAILDEETFDRVQIEKKRRSNEDAGTVLLSVLS